MKLRVAQGEPIGLPQGGKTISGNSRGRGCQPAQLGERLDQPEEPSPAIVGGKIARLRNIRQSPRIAADRQGVIAAAIVHKLGKSAGPLREVR